MSSNNLDYLKAIEAVDNTYPPAVGFSLDSAVTTTGDKVLIAQNNIIIELLLQLHNKLDRLTGQTAPLPASLAKQLESLTQNLSSFSVSKKPVVATPKQQIVVWKDPRAQLPK